MGSNLTEAAYYSRKGLKIGGLFIVAVLVLRSSVILTTNIIEILKPEPKELPNYQYGTRLPAIAFPPQSEVPPLTFSLETVDGKLPILDELAIVHIIPQRDYSVLTLQEARQKADKYGFTSEPRQLENITETVYQWRKGEEIASTLTMKVITQTFEYRYEYEKDQNMLNSNLLMNEETAIDQARDALRLGGFYPLDLVGGKKTTILYRYDPSGLKKVYTVVDADFIRVNHQRTDINELPVLSPNPEKTNVSVLVSKDQKNAAVEISSNYYPVNEISQATYPLKQSVDAWNELKNGHAFVASLGDNLDGDVHIRQVYLAYYDPNIPQDFLQPIYVFEGDDNFMAYVPALSNEVNAQSTSPDSTQC
ncbi:hypothetical protein MUP65_00320 [Patescibacteria group bacterium]|nr:hypothetical protein [Patescibacteria group bacterium]